MALKAVIDKLEAVDEGIRGEYTQGNDGRFYLALEGQPRGFVPSSELADANAKLSGFRDNNLGLKRELEEAGAKLKAFDGIDPAEHAELKASADGIRKKGIKNADDIEAIVQRNVEAAVKPLNTRIEELETDKTSALGELAKSEVRTKLTAAATASGVDVEHALDDFLERGQKVFTYKDGRVVALGPDGAPLYNPDKPAEQLTPEAWAATLVPKAPHLFKPNKGGGAGGGGGSASTVRVIQNDPVDFGKNAEAIAKGEVTTEAARAAEG